MCRSPTAADGPPCTTSASRSRPGQTVALVGHTGAGKSTAVGLLQRLRDPDAGAIRIDGIDIHDVSLDSLRANIGVVFQESMLFYRSIADNLRVGRPEASDAELMEAARLAEAHEFILAQPEGYATQIGERGATLSGGERQHLALARALLKDPPILILDEATNALDAATEAKVQTALRNVMRGRTTLVIAHRLSTVREADLILVFENGRIVERGSFMELLARRGLFGGLASTQLGTPAPHPPWPPDGQDRRATLRDAGVKCQRDNP
jgi:ATP-binding cassette, subfamily B, beta-glucan exporter